MAEVRKKDESSCTQNAKRQDYLEWDDYFMSVAFLSAQRSKDPRTQVGACIVDQDNRIVGIGYNGMPRGCSDDEYPWTSLTQTNDCDELNDKNLYVCHAELNAILNKNSVDLRNCKVYVALFPCNECAKLIIQSGINEVIYYSDKYHNKTKFKASRRMFQSANVRCRQFIPKKKEILIEFESINLHNNNNDNIDDKNVTIPSDLDAKFSLAKIE